MSRFPSDISASERSLAHKMKMAGKKYDRARRANAVASRAELFPSPSNVFPAHLNRHTCEPHMHSREIERRQRQAGNQA